MFLRKLKCTLITSIPLTFYIGSPVFFIYVLAFLLVIALPVSTFSDLILIKLNTKNKVRLFLAFIIHVGAAALITMSDPRNFFYLSIASAVIYFGVDEFLRFKKEASS
ncbi:low affinity Fe/Cu permease [Bacillus fengqiuensis]|nr:low affinity Fe/Cu permease [Bacillus fengqiuensis]